LCPSWDISRVIIVLRPDLCPWGIYILFHKTLYILHIFFFEFCKKLLNLSKILFQINFRQISISFQTNLYKFQTNLYKFSFVSITIKLLNNFIYSNTTLTETVFRNNFKENILFLYNKNIGPRSLFKINMLGNSLYLEFYLISALRSSFTFYFFLTLLII